MLNLVVRVKNPDACGDADGAQRAGLGGLLLASVEIANETGEALLGDQVASEQGRESVVAQSLRQACSKRFSSSAWSASCDTDSCREIDDQSAD